MGNWLLDFYTNLSFKFPDNEESGRRGMEIWVLDFSDGLPLLDGLPLNYEVYARLVRYF